MISDFSDEELFQIAHHPSEEDGKKALARELLVLRKAFSEPVAYTAQPNLDGFGGSVGYMWPPGNEKPTDIPLYRKPPTE